MQFAAGTERPIGLHDRMSELSGASAGAAIEPAIQNHAQTHAAAQADHQKIGDATRGAKPLLGHCSENSSRGELNRATPFTCMLKPRALRLLVPSGAPADLFAHAGAPLGDGVTHDA